MKVWIIGLAVFWGCLHAEVKTEIRTITQDDPFSIQKKAFFNKLLQRKPVYADLQPAWQDVATFEARHYKADMFMTREDHATLSSDLFFIVGDALDEIGGEFQCVDNLCPVIFGVKRYSGVTDRSKEYYNSNRFYDFTFTEWIVLDLKSPEDAVLHFMERGCSLKVKKDDARLTILDKHKCETKESLNFIATEYYSPYLFQASFDCDRAQTNSEVVICSYEQLADLDLQIDAYYQAILPHYPPIKVKQVEWIEQRNTCDISKDCLLDSLSERAVELSRVLGDLIEKKKIGRIDGAS